MFGSTFEISERFYALEPTIGTPEVITSGTKSLINWNLMMSKNIDCNLKKR